MELEKECRRQDRWRAGPAFNLRARANFLNPGSGRFPLATQGVIKKSLALFDQRRCERGQSLDVELQSHVIERKICHDLGL